MEVAYILDEMARKAKADRTVKEKLLATRSEPDPVAAFCREAGVLGFELNEIDLIMAGEELYTRIRRGTNGGGENSPLLEGEDDFYEMFFARLEAL